MGFLDDESEFLDEIEGSISDNFPSLEYPQWGESPEIFAHHVMVDKYETKRRKRFSRLLEICYLCRVNLPDLIVNEHNLKNMVIFEDNIPSTVGKRPKISKNTLNYEQIYDFLSESLQEIPPSPMTQVVKRLGISNKVLRRCFPKLCKKISQRYLIHKKQSRLERIQRVCTEVEQAVEQLRQQGIYPSEQQVALHISQSGCFRDKEVREALHKTRRQTTL